MQTLVVLAATGIPLAMKQHKAAFAIILLVPVAISIRAGAQTPPAQPVVSTDTASNVFIPPNRLLRHVPDPDLQRQAALELLEQARQANDTGTVMDLTRIFERVDSIRRSEQMRLTLEDALHRALANSFVIDVQRYNPAIETTRVVEAEAAFDAVFFTNITKNKVDQPTASQLFANDLDAFDSSYGVRKLLPTGMLVTGFYSLSREKTTLQFQELNPAYTSALALEIRQPLLRGFGIDVNRAWIYIYKNNRRISDLAFQRAVRDTILEVEKAYWALVQARRDIVVTSRLLADFERIYDYLEARRQYDVMEVQLAETKADLELARAEFVQRRATVFDAEDRLIAAMNSPEITLADNIEIIPEDFPQLTPFVVDRLAEVQTALVQKPEVQEARLQVDNAKIAVGQAKNAELPVFDVNFTYRIQGLAGNADKSFDEVSRHKFVTYVAGVQFELPIGNRGPRAAHHRARLEHAAAKAALKAEIENAIFVVNVATRGLTTSYDQIMPAFESTEARERQVESIIARAERKDIATLSTELGAHRDLAETRRSLLRVMINYNVAIIELEKAKGTLLRYYNVVIPTEEEE